MGCLLPPHFNLFGLYSNKSDSPGAQLRAKPFCSNIKANGNVPCSIKCEKIKTSPLECLIDLKIEENLIENFSIYVSSAKGASFLVFKSKIACFWYLYLTVLLERSVLITL